MRIEFGFKSLIGWKRTISVCGWLILSLLVGISQAQAAKPIAIIKATTPVIEGYKNTLDGSRSYDVDRDALTYSWRQIMGAAAVIDNPSAAVTSFTNPMIEKTDKPTKKLKLLFELTVDDGKNRDNKTVQAIVWPVNAYPVPSPGPNKTVTASDAVDGINLDGSASTDDGQIVKYQWKLLSKLPKKAKFRLSNAKSELANFTYSYPDQSAPITLEFQLTVVDNDKVKRSANTLVTILHQGGVLPPVANAGVDQKVLSDAIVTLSGVQTTGNVASYGWVQLAGPDVILVNQNTETASFKAPNLSANTVLSFRLTVQNAGGASEDTVNITVTPHVPAANAGDDKPVVSGATVNLNGNQSSGFIDSYSWIQIQGPQVDLSNAANQIASFTAPDVSKSTDLIFKLTVTNADAGSSDDNVIISVRPSPPVAQAGGDQSAFSGLPVSLSGSQSTGHIDTYVWSQIAGPTVILSGQNSVAAGFTAPNVTTPTLLSFKLKISNDSGASEDTLNVTVMPRIPTANAGGDQTVFSNVSVALSGSQSSGVIDNYTWAQTAGPSVVLSGSHSASAGFVSPNVNSNTILSFKLSVSNSSGSSDDTVNINVKPMVPVANAGGDQNVLSNSTVNLSASQSTGFIDSYSWSQVSGTSVTLSNPSSATPTFIAPNVANSEVLVFKVIAVNSSGYSEDTVSVTVSSSEIPPIANAGSDQTVIAGATVSLNGSQSQGTSNTFIWTQISGSSVMLSGANDALASFVAPEVNNPSTPETLVFKLTATNSQGVSDDTITITVTPRLPSANAGIDQTVSVGDSVTLAAGQSTGQIGSYLWTQTAGVPTVNLVGATTAAANFTAPNVTVQTILTFKLVTTNISGSTDDSVNITINPNITGTLNLQVGNVGNILNLSLDNVQGGLAPYNFTIKWGDGNVHSTGTTPSGTHTYTTTGNFTVTMTVVDSNGLSEVFTKHISVAEVGCGLPN